MLYYEIANLLAASGRKQQAIEYYRLSIQQDPLQPDALLKLAALLGRSAEAASFGKRPRECCRTRMGETRA